jgi:hypothetical protein
MKPYLYRAKEAASALPSASTKAAGPERKLLVTRFGDAIDVRNRGTLKVTRLAGSQAQVHDAPAVVRLWTNQQCRELTAHQARMLAEQLLAAASLAELQNGHEKMSDRG